MSSPSPPAPPDPVATANAQTASNKATAVTQYGLNATDQVTPYGNLSYSQGTPWSDGTPHYTATTTLSPDQQQLLNLQTSTQKNLGQIGVDQSAKVGSILNTPFDLNAATSNQQAKISQQLLDPVWQQRQSQLQTQLANQGIQQGSEAYTNAMRDFGMQRDNSYNSALLADRGQASQEALTQRNQPLNEISALMSGSQVSQPNFVGTPQTQVAPTDVIGAYNNAYQGQMQGYNAQMQQQNAIYGALGSAAGTALGGWGMGGFKFSDRRLKYDIKQIGTTFKGTPIYAYRMVNDPAMQLGFMAQEIEHIVPDAVREFDGVKMVNYERAIEGA